jgi:hypothetical protein
MFLGQANEFDQYLNAQLSTPILGKICCLRILREDTFWSADLLVRASFMPKSLVFIGVGRASIRFGAVEKPSF